MNRRNLLRALCLAPLAPVAAKLAMLEGPAPTILRSTANQGFGRATNFGTNNPEAMKGWSRDLFNEVRERTTYMPQLAAAGVIEIVP